jgi:hypothetical protein
LSLLDLSGFSAMVGLYYKDAGLVAAASRSGKGMCSGSGQMESVE